MHAYCLSFVTTQRCMPLAMLNDADNAAIAEHYSTIALPICESNNFRLCPTDYSTQHHKGTAM